MQHYKIKIQKLDTANKNNILELHVNKDREIEARREVEQYFAQKDYCGEIRILSATKTDSKDSKTTFSKLETIRIMNYPAAQPIVH